MVLKMSDAKKPTENTVLTGEAAIAEETLFSSENAAAAGIAGEIVAESEDDDDLSPRTKKTVAALIVLACAIAIAVIYVGLQGS